MNGYRLRTATPDDAEAVARYHGACFHQNFAAQLASGAAVAPDPELDRQRFRDWFTSGSQFPTLIAVCLDDTDDEPIGHVTTRDASLVHLFVHPEHQGVGLGRQLLATGESTIASAGHRVAELHTRVDNARAVAFYRAAHWALEEHVITTVEYGVSYREYVMVKELR